MLGAVLVSVNRSLVGEDSVRRHQPMVNTVVFLHRKHQIWRAAASKHEFPSFRSLCYPSGIAAIVTRDIVNQPSTIQIVFSVINEKNEIYEVS